MKNWQFVIAIIGFLVAGITFYNKVDAAVAEMPKVNSRINAVEREIEGIKPALTAIKDVVVRIERQVEKLDDRVDQVRSGPR